MKSIKIFGTLYEHNDKDYLIKINNDKQKNKEKEKNYTKYDSFIQNPELGSCAYSSFLSCFNRSYASNENLNLNPDDVWCFILLYFCQVLKKNKVDVKKFLKNEKNIISLEKYDTKNIYDMAKSNFKDEFIYDITGDFSTTTDNKLYNSFFLWFYTFSTSEIYITKPHHNIYISKDKDTPNGVDTVNFDGEKQDWEKIISKIEKLRTHININEWDLYVDKLLPVLHNFLNTFNEEIDLNFWKMFEISELIKDDNGKNIDKKLKGWPLYFHGIYTESNVSNICDITIKTVYKIIFPESVGTFYDESGFYNIKDVKSMRPFFHSCVTYETKSIKENKEKFLKTLYQRLNGKEEIPFTNLKKDILHVKFKEDFLSIKEQNFFIAKSDGITSRYYCETAEIVLSVYYDNYILLVAIINDIKEGYYFKT